MNDRYAAEQEAARCRAELEAVRAELKEAKDKIWALENVRKVDRQSREQVAVQLNEARREAEIARLRADIAGVDARAAALREAQAERAELRALTQSAITEAAVERNRARRVQAANEKLAAELHRLAAELEAARAEAGEELEAARQASQNSVWHANECRRLIAANAALAAELEAARAALAADGS